MAKPSTNDTTNTCLTPPSATGMWAILRQPSSEHSRAALEPVVDGHPLFERRNHCAPSERSASAEKCPELREHLWVLAHRTIALDLEDTVRALERMRAAGTVHPWEVEGIRMWWRRVVSNITLHQDQEEEIIFPILCHRMRIPLKISSDHRRLSRTIASASATFEYFGVSTTVDDCLAEVLHVQEIMLPHMHDEEVALLPGLMKKFTPSDYQHIEREMARQFVWIDAPHFHRQFGCDLEKKRQIFQRLTGLPGFLFGTFHARDFERYDVEYGYLIEALKDPACKAFLDEQRQLYAIKAATRRRPTFCVPSLMASCPRVQPESTSSAWREPPSSTPASARLSSKAPRMHSGPQGAADSTQSLPALRTCEPREAAWQPAPVCAAQ